MRNLDIMLASRMGEDAEALLTVGLILNRTVTPIGCYYYYRVPLACHTEYARSGDGYGDTQIDNGRRFTHGTRGYEW